MKSLEGIFFNPSTSVPNFHDTITTCERHKTTYRADRVFLPGVHMAEAVGTAPVKVVAVPAKFRPASTLNTGNSASEHTVTEPERLTS